MFTSEEQERYSRHFVLLNFGVQAQEYVKKASVLVIGAGGLGAPLLQYLAAAGLGTIGIVDYDTVSLSNLQRQVLYNTKEVGQNKVDKAAIYLKNLNPNITIQKHSEAITSSNALELIKTYDIIADGSDNFATRYLVNDACVILDKPLVFGAVHGYEGQCSVFNYKGGTNYRDVHPTPPNPNAVPNCAEGGVLGALPGVIGSIMALEVIKLAAKIPPGLAGKMYIFDSLHFYNQKINLGEPNPDNKVTKLINYDSFCSGPLEDKIDMKEINANTLKDWMESAPETTHLIDVRENYERALGHIGGMHIPLAQIIEQKNTIPTSGNVIFYCSGGVRSAYAIEQLQSHPNALNFYNLENGLSKWQA